MRKVVKTAPGCIGALFRVWIGPQVAKHCCVTGQWLDENQPVVASFSQVLPTFFRLFPRCDLFATTTALLKLNNTRG